MSIPSFVVDTSVAVKWFLKEPFEEQALRLRDAFQKKGCRLLAPDLIYSEFANTIWRSVSFNRLDENFGRLMVADFLMIPIEIVPSRDLLLIAYKLGTDFNRPVYDALYLALSVIKEAPFITADKRFYNALRSEFSNIIYLKDFSMYG